MNGIGCIAIFFGFNFDSLYRDNKNELIDKNFYSLIKEDFEKKYPNKIFPIKFEDEQFIPTQPNVSKILLSKDDAPIFVNEFYDRYKILLKHHLMSERILLLFYKGQNNRLNYL